MEDRVVLVAGGARGIGRATAVALAARGWHVAFCYRAHDAQAASLSMQLSRSGSKVLGVKCDVSDAAQAEGFVRRTEKEFGRIDALVNCFGPQHRAPLLEESLDDWHTMFDHNLHPVFYLSRLVAPQMRARKWGRIVNFSMASADQGVAQPNITAFYLAKQAVLTLTRAYAKQLAPFGVTVNSISPGVIDSGNVPSEDLSRMVPNIPAGYVGGCDDAAATVCWLLSDDAHYVNGTNLHLSGAWGI